MLSTIRIPRVLCALALLPALAMTSLSCAGGPAYRENCAAQSLPEREVAAGNLSFVRRQLLSGVCGPAYATSADFRGNGTPQLLVSGYGKSNDSNQVSPGSVRLYDFAAPESSTELIAPADALYFPHRPLATDLDADGDVDLVVGLGFFPCTFVLFGEPCGGLVILENDGAGAMTRHDLVTPGDIRFFHGVAIGDVDGDGIRDLVTVAEVRQAPWDAGTAQTLLFRGFDNTLADGFVPAPQVVSDGMGPFPQLIDLDSDGDLDIAGASFFGDAPGFHWVENLGTSFARHEIYQGAGPSIQGTATVDATGQARFFGSNHANPVRKPEGPPARFSMFIPGEDPRVGPWTEVVLFEDFDPIDATGQFSPGVFGFGDINGDGLVDIVLSGDGDARVFLFLSVAAAAPTTKDAFTVHVLADDMRQAGGVLFVDTDRDGDLDIVVTAYESDATVIFENTTP